MQVRLIKREGKYVTEEDINNVISIEQSEDFGLVITRKEYDGSTNKREIPTKDILHIYELDVVLREKIIEKEKEVENQILKGIKEVEVIAKELREGVKK